MCHSLHTAPGGLGKNIRFKKALFFEKKKKKTFDSSNNRSGTSEP
jgi:hypothetical protein